MSNQPNWRDSVAAIRELERRDAPATFEERIAELLQVCRDAAAFEKSSQGEQIDQRPWPESTRAFLRDRAKAIYGA